DARPGRPRLPLLVRPLGASERSSGVAAGRSGIAATPAFRPRHRPPTDHRPPTTDHRPDYRPPTTDQCERSVRGARTLFNTSTVSRVAGTQSQLVSDPLDAGGGSAVRSAPKEVRHDPVPDRCVWLVSAAGDAHARGSCGDARLGP